MSKRLLTVSLAIAVASALIFIPLTAGSQEGRPDGAAPGAAAPSNDGGATLDEGTWDGDGPAPRDQVILDDLIVDGSICAGLDCVNGESFGFDTLRLKENNLRIKFQDTSSSASFPTNDWQITANDSSNGGANKFSIDDIDGGRTPFTIEASAPSHSLFVDDGGRIGLGTSTPVTEVHIKDGDTPTVRLEQDGSSGFTAQTWDLAGNETNFFVRDATMGSQLPFRIRPGADSNTLFLDADNDVGIGTSSPANALDVTRSGTGDAKLRVFDDTTSFEPRLILENTNASNNFVGMRYVLGNGDNSIDVNATLGQFRVNIIDGDPFELSLNAAGDLTVTGSLFSAGGTCGGGCDAVFSPDFDVPTIDEHAAFMWENSHLKAVGPTPENARINLSQKTGGILHELELAHIYIEQLNNQIKALEKRLAELEN